MLMRAEEAHRRSKAFASTAVIADLIRSQTEKGRFSLEYADVDCIMPLMCEALVQKGYRVKRTNSRFLTLTDHYTISW